ncbi:MAG: YdcF family protein [Terriglobia bacterium]
MTAHGIGQRLLMILVVLALLAGAAFWALRNVGRWLVDPDPLQHARAIVVLSGKTPFRAMEAAQIYRQNWAPEVWLLRDETADADATFAKLGIPHPSEQEYDRMVLERLGVPQKAIRILEPATSNTVSEIVRIADELRQRGGDTVILVTSPVHTRRSKFIWHMVVGNFPHAVLRSDSSEPCDPDHWWRSTGDIQDVEHEVLGLIDARLGFVAKPR